MSSPRLSHVLAGAGFAMTLLAAPALAGGPMVAVTGGMIEGVATDGVSAFKGIPYAADTSGANRFRAPQPVQPWPATFDASAYGPMCPGLGGLEPPGAPEAAENGDPGLTPPSEDCLRLNVWTAATDAGKRPVIVYLHGGGYVTGTGNISWYDGTRLARNHDVVFVSINYRLNIFGFLDLTGIDPSFARDANAGLQDMVAALRWVHDNIDRFGGNPGNVTLMGQSAGAQAALLLLGAPSASGLFQRVIADSPLLDPPAPPPQADGQAHASLDQLGIGTDIGSLQALPWDKVIAGFTGNGPVADGTFLPAGADLAGAVMAAPGIPLLVGWNRTEGTFFQGPTVVADDAALVTALASQLGSDAAAKATIAAYRADWPDVSANELYFRIGSDTGFGKAALVAARSRAAAGGAPVYLYRFDAPTIVRNLMTPHTLDLGYVLDNLALTKALSGPPTEAMQALADTMSTAWTSFARTGDPALAGWTPVDVANPMLMRFDVKPELMPLPQSTRTVVGW